MPSKYIYIFKVGLAEPSTWKYHFWFENCGANTPVYLDAEPLIAWKAGYPSDPTDILVEIDWALWLLDSHCKAFPKLPPSWEGAYQKEVTVIRDVYGEPVRGEKGGLLTAVVELAHPNTGKRFVATPPPFAVGWN